jgi:hypothetical protein
LICFQSLFALLDSYIVRLHDPEHRSYAPVRLSLLFPGYRKNRNTELALFVQ